MTYEYENLIKCVSKTWMKICQLYSGHFRENPAPNALNRVTEMGHH